MCSSLPTFCESIFQHVFSSIPSSGISCLMPSQIQYLLSWNLNSILSQFIAELSLSEQNLDFIAWESIFWLTLFFAVPARIRNLIRTRLTGHCCLGQYWMDMQEEDIQGYLEGLNIAVMFSPLVCSPNWECFLY